MLYSRIYNNAYTDDLRQAYSVYDASSILNEAKRLSAIIAVMDDTEDGHDLFVDTTSRLLICLALLDSLKNRGAAIRLMADVINF